MEIQSFVSNPQITYVSCMVWSFKNNVNTNGGEDTEK